MKAFRPYPLCFLLFCVVLQALNEYKAMEPSNTELILIRITGEDRPGLTSSIMGILARYDVTVLDIGQADIHNTLTLGLLVRAAEEYSGHVMRDLLFKASELGVNIRFYPVKKDEYADWVNMQGKNRYILTLLGRKLSALQIQAVTSVLAEQGLNIDAIKRLTGRIPLDEQRENIRACIEFSVRGTPKDRAAMQSKLLKLSSELEMDFSFQLDNMYRRMRRLICFDMDSTLIETEVIDELADEQKNEPGIVGMQPISHAEGKVPANKRPKSAELHSPWADGRTFPGTGKNAQCPCGSGRKYKMCHGQNEA